MPNTREKLIELLTQVAVLGDYLDMRKVADHLIANGVTVKQWIPVSERLPEEPGHFLVVVKERYAFENDYSYDTDVAHYRLDGGYIDGCWDTFCDWDEGQPYLHVTHWMPLPEPPRDATE